jgi:hypothetical protein
LWREEEEEEGGGGGESYNEIGRKRENRSYICVEFAEQKIYK